MSQKQNDLNNDESACVPYTRDDTTAGDDDAYRCPVCQAVIPPEHLGRKVWCRRCGYLESCCNPI